MMPQNTSRAGDSPDTQHNMPYFKNFNVTLERSCAANGLYLFTFSLKLQEKELAS